MATGAVTIDVPAPPDDVWAVVGDFCKIDALLSGVESFRCDGDVRIIGIDGLELTERLLERDHDARVLRYGIVAGLPVDHHEATISVAPAGDGTGASTVTWRFEVLPDERVPGMTATYTGLLEALRTQFS